MGVKGHSRGGLGTPRRLALGRSCLIPKADEGCSQDDGHPRTRPQVAGIARLLTKGTQQWEDGEDLPLGYPLLPFSCPVAAADPSFTPRAIKDRLK